MTFHDLKQKKKILTLRNRILMTKDIYETIALKSTLI